jgi:protein-tyrosine phosphatase
MNLLFVCTANISRSFLAEQLFKHKIEGLKLNDVFSDSAGIFGMPGRTADPVMVAYLEELGIDPIEHVSTQIEKEHIDWADLILVMEWAHLEKIELSWPEDIDKVELLGKYITNDDNEDEILDPFGRSSFHYRVAHSQIQLAIDGLIRRRVLI